MDPADADGQIRALYDIAEALRALGTKHAMTDMGAIEALADRIHDGLGHVGDAIITLAVAIESTNCPTRPKEV